MYIFLLSFSPFRPWGLGTTRVSPNVSLGFQWKFYDANNHLKQDLANAWGESSYGVDGVQLLIEAMSQQSPTHEAVVSLRRYSLCIIGKTLSYP